MIKHGLWIILAGFLTTTNYAGVTSSSEVVKLLRQISDKLTSIDKRLQKLEKKQAKKTLLSSMVPHSQNGPNITALSEIEFPKKPDKKNIKEYIWNVQTASPNQNCFSPHDMQVALLKKVGHANIDLLIKALNMRSGPRFNSRYHLEYAIKDMAEPSDKEMIIKALPFSTTLIDVIVRYGWEKDVRKILIDKLLYTQYLPTAWIAAVAGFQDPETYDLLKKYFISNGDRIGVYEVIKDLPGIKLDDAVDEAWKMAKCQENNDWQKFNTSMVAVEYGNKEALEYLLNNYANPRFSYHAMKSRRIIKDHVDFKGSNYEIKNWFNKNKQNIVFDKNDKKFKLKAGK